MRPIFPAFLSVAALLHACGLSAARAEPPLRFDVTLAGEVADAPIDGRLFVMLSQQERVEPRLGPNWFQPEPFFGQDVTAFAPLATHSIDDAADGFPQVLSRLPAGKYRAQAVLHHSFEEPSPGTAEGNFHSGVVELDWDGAGPLAVPLSLDQVAPARPFPESPSVQEVVLPSKLLADYHGREVRHRAGVVLPAGYDEQLDRRYPVIYSIPGFGGDHRQALGYLAGTPPAGEGETEFIRVFLSAQCRQGHHVFADSAANGPRGQALVEELIPHIDATFRTVPAAEARFVTGHSSGGWSSLWLQASYPGAFGGVWSTSPDPVDFRDWQQVDLYASPPLSLFVDEAGQRRPLARRGEMPVLWYDSFCRMDDVLGVGGQLRSFEAVFSPLGPDGRPLRMWDRATGRVDPEVVRAWEAYDINLKLKRNWGELGPQLAGKLHIATGTLDTFYLEGAVERLAETLGELGSDAEIEMVEGADHGSLLTAERFAQMRRQMTAAYRRHYPE